MSPAPDTLSVSARPDGRPTQDAPAGTQQWARLLGATHQAEQLGSDRVGTEHLLLATLADPWVGKLLADRGIHLGHLRAHAGSHRDGPTRGSRRARPTPDPRTVAVLGALAREASTDRVLLHELAPHGPWSPAQRGRLLRHLFVRLLLDPTPSPARTIIEGLGLSGGVSRAPVLAYRDRAGVDPRGSILPAVCALNGHSPSYQDTTAASP